MRATRPDRRIRGRPATSASRTRRRRFATCNVTPNETDTVLISGLESNPDRRLSFALRGLRSYAEECFDHLDDERMVIGLRQAGDGDAADHPDLADTDRERAAVCREQPRLDAQRLV